MNTTITKRTITSGLGAGLLLTAMATDALAVDSLTQWHESCYGGAIACVGAFGLDLACFAGPATMGGTFTACIPAAGASLTCAELHRECVAGAADLPNHWTPIAGTKPRRRSTYEDTTCHGKFIEGVHGWWSGDKVRGVQIRCHDNTWIHPRIGQSGTQNDGLNCPETSYPYLQGLGVYYSGGELKGFKALCASKTNLYNSQYAHDLVGNDKDSSGNSYSFKAISCASGSYAQRIRIHRKKGSADIRGIQLLCSAKANP